VWVSRQGYAGPVLRSGPPSAAPAGWPWVVFVLLDVTDSTNRVAMEMAENGAPHGPSSSPTRRPRAGDGWAAGGSLRGKNLYVSLLLRPPVPTVDAPRLALVAGVALADAVEAVGVPASLKWPNDLYCGERKAAGILAEMASDPDGVRHVVIGVGLNVNMEEDDFLPDLRGTATSLRIRAGRAFRRVDVLARVLDAFGRGTQNHRGRFASLRDGWTAATSSGAARPPSAAGRGRVGTADGLDAHGALRFLPTAAR